MPARSEAPRGRTVAGAPMSRYNSWRAGGAAETLFFPEDVGDLALYLAGLGEGESVLFVGLGSNLLVRDGGIAGTVVRTAPGLCALEDLGGGAVRAEAGVAMPKLSRFAASCGLGGAGFMAGVPGTVGGALAMNAGCFGSETWELVSNASVALASGEVRVLDAAEFEVGYRSVRHREVDPLWFVAAEFSFPPRREGEDESDREVMRRRDATQPIGTANSGSVFKNPPGDSAGRLIEASGLAGRKVGGAAVSEKHCNFIVNTGGASAADIEGLIEEVRKETKRSSGVELELEVRIVGDRA